MPGKHAPASSRSFLISLGTAVGGALVALGVVVGIALVALNAGSSKPEAGPTVIQSTTPPPATHSSTPEATSTSAAALIPIGDTKLRILNGSGRSGQAAAMAQRAEHAGYPTPFLGNTTSTAKSTVFYRSDSKREAERFQREFPEFTEIAPAPSSFQSDVNLTVVVGLDYPASSSTASPTHSAKASPSPSPSKSR